MLLKRSVPLRESGDVELVQMTGFPSFDPFLFLTTGRRGSGCDCSDSTSG